MPHPSSTGLRLPVVIYVLALLAGLALAASFARFNSIHREFLDANFDAVHGARTLLKARHCLGQAEERLKWAQEDGDRRQTQIGLAIEALALAESYGAEGKDASPQARNELTARIRVIRDDLSLMRRGERVGAPGLAEIGAAVRHLAEDYEAAELDRWGTLSSMNAALATRMEQMRLFNVAIVSGFVLLMAVLGWALRRARQAATDLRQAKEAAEAIQQTTLDASPMGIVYIDHSDPRIVLANRQMAEIFGYSPGELPGVRVADLHVSAAGYRRFADEAVPRLEKGEVQRQELRMRRKNGEHFWCALSGKAIDAKDRARGAVWTCEDISERKAAEAELLAAHEKAKAASRAKSEFLANISHEIRTPFTGILGVLELLLRSRLDDKQDRYVRLARDSTNQLLAIVNDILDVASIEAGKPAIRPVDFAPGRLFSEIVPLHEAAASRKNLAFACTGTDRLPDRLHGDPVRLRQIVDNLVNNAIKFTPEGRVELDVACRPADGGMNRLRIEVRDTGIGIPTELHAAIFEKFTQADASATRVFGGAGLGLAICKELVAQMGGRIGVDSRVGVGSLFWCEIDLAPATSATPAAVPARADTGHQTLAGLRVLLADDAEVNREMLVEALAGSGCAIHEARDGAEALDMAVAWSPDVILMDCQMPGMDGYEATRRIRASEGAGRHVTIIALTAHAMNGDRDSCLAAGMDDYLAKPVTYDALLGKIVAWTRAKRTTRPAVEPTPPPASGDARFVGRILLVDDDPSVREACRGLLEIMGCDVVLAASGREALELGAGDDFDLVLLDCYMPGMDGWATARAWRAGERDRERTGIVALTGNLSEENRRSCREAGMDDFLAKPFAASGLADLLERWLGHAG